MAKCQSTIPHIIFPHALHQWNTARRINPIELSDTIIPLARHHLGLLQALAEATPPDPSAPLDERAHAWARALAQRGLAVQRDVLRPGLARSPQQSLWGMRWGRAVALVDRERARCATVLAAFATDPAAVQAFLAEDVGMAVTDAALAALWQALHAGDWRESPAPLFWLREAVRSRIEPDVRPPCSVFPPRRGRPVGSGTFPTRNDLLSTLLPIVRAYILDTERAPTQSFVVAMLAQHGQLRTSERQMQRWLKQHHLTWPEVLKLARDEIMSCFCRPALGYLLANLN